jgi:tetratricopeptide (TPR) repeat protein
MPRTEEIERFAEVLNSLGDEPAIRAARAETIEQIAPPGQSTAEGDEALFTAADEVGAGAAEPGGEQEGLQDLFEGLSSLPGDAEPTSELREGQPEEAPGASAEGLDFSSLFGEETGQQPIEDLASRPAPRRGRAAPAPEPDAFTIPEGELPDLQADLGEMEVLPDTGAGAPSAAAVEGLEDLSALGLEAPEEGGEPAQAAGEGESFELPNLEDLGLGDGTEAGAAPAAGGEEAPDVGEGAPTEADFQAPSEEDFGKLQADFGELPEIGEPVEAGEIESPLGDLTPGGEPGAGLEPPSAEPSFEVPEGPAAEEASLGDLDMASFESPEEPAGAGAAERTGAEPEALGEEALGEETLANLDLAEFSLPESAEQFGVPEAAAPRAAAKEPPRPRAVPKKPQPRRQAPPPPPRRPAAPQAAAPLAGAPGEEVSLTPEQFRRLRATLDGLPRNLKIAVQDLIGEGAASPADTARLISLLVGGAAAQEIAVLAGRISGKRIRVPAGYEKKSGVAFEAEQRTFAYAFRQNILPLIRVVVITVLAGAMLAYLGYSYIYRPLSAAAAYRAGYEQIRADRFTAANQNFERARQTWKMKDWYFRYADAFTGKRAFVQAEEKYEQILHDWPDDKKGILDYARLESTALGDYTKADTLLRRILDKDLYDYDALLAAGDNDMEWARRDPSKYGAARLVYATLLEKNGLKDVLLFRMLRYFIRTDNYQEADRLRAYFASRRDTKIDGEVYAELGGYMVDHRRLTYAQDVLFAAQKARPDLPQVHYQLARYYRLVQSPENEKKALDATVTLLERTREKAPLTRERIGMEFDTHTRLGEYYYTNREYIAAENELEEATRLIERFKRNRQLVETDRRIGRPYAVLGDLSYYIQGDLSSADGFYRAAIVNGYTNPELTYKIGFIAYKRDDFKAALEQFTEAEEATAHPVEKDYLPPIAPPPDPRVQPKETPPEKAERAAGEKAAAEKAAAVEAAPLQPPVNLLYALGNCFFQRGDYFAAQGYYLRLLNRLDATRASLGTLVPEEKPRDRGLLELLAKTNNNLGITMIKLAERTGDRRKRSEGMVNLTAAAQVADSLARMPGDDRRSRTMSMPSQNIRAALWPTRGTVPVIIPELPRDFESLSW